jgi:hypothetical protein
VHIRHLPVIVVVSNDYENECLSMFDARADDVIGVPLPILDFFLHGQRAARGLSVVIQ